MGEFGSSISFCVPVHVGLFYSYIIWWSCWRFTNLDASEGKFCNKIWDFPKVEDFFVSSYAFINEFLYFFVAEASCYNCPSYCTLEECKDFVDIRGCKWEQKYPNSNFMYLSFKPETIYIYELLRLGSKHISLMQHFAIWFMSECRINYISEKNLIIMFSRMLCAITTSWLRHVLGIS